VDLLEDLVLSKDQPVIRIRISENIEYHMSFDDFLAFRQGKRRIDPHSEICKKLKLVWDKSDKWKTYTILDRVPDDGGYQLIERTCTEINTEAVNLLWWAKSMGCEWAKDEEYPTPLEDNIK